MNCWSAVSPKSKVPTEKAKMFQKTVNERLFFSVEFSSQFDRKHVFLHSIYQIDF